MTVRFVNRRIAFYVCIFLLSGTVLGVAANFANLLPSSQSISTNPQPPLVNLFIHNDFTIFSIIVPSLTILIFLLTIQWSQPRIEAISLFLLGVLWLTMGAWSTDITGSTQCDVLGGFVVPTKKGTMPAQAYCYEMRIIQAFSWVSTALFTIALVILLSLANQAQRWGRILCWQEPIQELGWFGELPGYYNQTSAPMYPAYAYGYQGNPQQVITTVNGVPTMAQVPV